MKKQPTINQRRRTALFNWASQQRASYLASLLNSVLSNKEVKMLIEESNIKVE